MVVVYNAPNRYIFQLERTLLQQQIRKYASYVTGNVLDIGGGEFQRYKHFFNYTKYTSMDVYEAPDVDVIGSADNIPFPNNMFDSAVCTQVFEHIKFPEKSAQEAYRVLKEGGHLLITVPQWNELHSEPHDYWRYTKYGLIELFERNGFQTVSYEQRGGYFAQRAQMRIRFYIDKYSLYRHPFIGRIASRLFQLYGSYSIWRDKLDTSEANRKHAIGWCFVFQKR